MVVTSVVVHTASLPEIWRKRLFVVMPQATATDANSATKKCVVAATRQILGAGFFDARMLGSSLSSCL